jgi:hypothetical protein
MDKDKDGDRERALSDMVRDISRRPVSDRDSSYKEENASSQADDVAEHRGRASKRHFSRRITGVSRERFPG